MRNSIATTCLVLGTMLAPVAAYAADGDADRANPANFVKDSVITTKITAKLAAEHLGSAKHISVDTDRDGVVWMTGTANSFDAVWSGPMGDSHRSARRGRAFRPRPGRPGQRTCKFDRGPSTVAPIGMGLTVSVRIPTVIRS